MLCNVIFSLKLFFLIDFDWQMELVIKSYWFSFKFPKHEQKNVKSFLCELSKDNFLGRLVAGYFSFNVIKSKEINLPPISRTERDLNKNRQTKKSFNY